MITDFDKYESVNEASSSKIIGLAIYLTFLFNSFHDTNQQTKSKNVDYDFFVKYLNVMDVATKNATVKEVIRDFKHKVTNDPKILNKQEVLKTIDDTPILFRNDDKICYILYQKAKEKYNHANPSSWCTTVSPQDTVKNKPFSVIFLSKSASYYEVMHELSHAIETVVKIDPRIAEPFNFKLSHEEVNINLKLMSGFNLELKSSIQRQHIEYLSDPSEIYSRVNSFKMFLYRNKIIKTPNDDITERIALELMTGHIYYNLNDKAKKEFEESDFIDLLMFLDTRKSEKLNKYVQNIILQKKRNGGRFA